MSVNQLGDLSAKTLFLTFNFPLFMKVLIVDDLHPIIMEMLALHQIECNYQPGLSPEVLQEIIPHYEGLVMRSHTPITETLLTHATKLKFVAKAGSGMDNIDEIACQKRNILMINAPEGNRTAVAEFTIGALLALARNLTIANTQVKQYQWQREENRGFELKGKTIGIIGFGNIGSALAQRLQGFDMNILAYDKYKTGFSNAYVQECDEETLLTKADIITLHVPLTTETNAMINENWLNRCKKSIVLLNMARGKIVDLKAVIKALEIGKIRGLALDVLPNENFTSYTTSERQTFEYLSSFEQVLLSPHIAGWSYESKVKLSEVLANKILKISIV